MKVGPHSEPSIQSGQTGNFTTYYTGTVLPGGANEGLCRCFFLRLRSCAVAASGHRLEAD